MECKIHCLVKPNGTVSTKGSTPIEDVPEFVNGTTMTLKRWVQIRKEIKNFMNQYLDQFPHTHREPRIPGSDTVTILRSEYEGMKSKIAEQAIRIEALEKENAELRRENAELRKTVEMQSKQIEMQSKQIEMLVHRIEFLEARN
jgi:chromosome segregation ATPase